MRFLFLVLALTPAAVMAQKMPYAVEATTRTAIRATPSAVARSVGTVAKGAELQVYAENKRAGWYYVTRGRLRGWIPEAAIVPVRISASADSEEDLPDIPETVGTRSRVKNWTRYGTTSDDDLYYQPFTILWAESVARLWDKRISKQTGAESMTYTVIDCGRMQFTMLDSVDYDRDGRVVKSSNFKDVAKAERIVPDSAIYNLAGVICPSRRTTLVIEN